jgi:uncharacterized protein
MMKTSIFNLKPASLQNAVLVTHKACADGSGSALLFMEAGGKRENIRFVAAGQVERMLKETNLLDDPRFILFADVGIDKKSKGWIDDLEKRGNLVLLDHHETSLHLSDREWAYIDMDACGTELMRQFIGLEDQCFVRYASIIDDHDRWVRKQLPHSEDLATFHYFIGQEQFLDRFTGSPIRFRNNYPDPYLDFLTEHEREMTHVIKVRQAELIKDALGEKKLHFRKVNHANGRDLAVAYSFAKVDNYSILLDGILSKYPNVDIAVLVHMNSNTVSLRSRKGDVNVAELALAFGGGGHPSASGHQLSDSLVADFVSAIHLGQKNDDRRS